MDDFNNRVDEIMEKHNNRFGREPTREESAFVPLDMNEDNLKRILSIREYRNQIMECHLGFTIKGSNSSRMMEAP